MQPQSEQKMASEQNSSHESAVRRIPLDHPLEFGHIEAWINIIKSYESKHPDHQITILYEGQPVYNLAFLYRQRDTLNHEHFEILVDAPDGNRANVSKLIRMMVEGAGPNYQHFIAKELYQILKLF